LADAAGAWRVALKKLRRGEVMAGSKTYLVAIDFSRESERALDYALTMARENKGKVIAVHVVPSELIYPPTGGRIQFHRWLEEQSGKKFVHLAKRKKITPQQCRFILLHGADFGEAVVRQAKKLRASMIVMGSHGRKGVERFFLGSVAERTIRYADCPVLIVKT
jgi:nucleotide-binding universal stress UspA family protein